MPELPEVETVVSILRPQLLNLKITKIRLFNNKIIKEPSIEKFKKIIVNQTIREVTRKAKHIIFKLEGWVLICHLRMEGKFFIKPIKTETDWKHILIAMELSNNKELLYHDTRQFGTMHLQPIDDYLNIKPLVNVGYEPFDKKMTVSYLKQAWGKRTIALKQALLEQKIISGIGNIYANEICFACHLLPTTPLKNLTDLDLAKIIEESQRILKAAIKKGGTTIFSFHAAPGIDGKFVNNLKIHGRKNLPCFSCGSNIIKIKLNNRGTYYCPKCQS